MRFLPTLLSAIRSQPLGRERAYARPLLTLLAALFALGVVAPLHEVQAASLGTLKIESVIGEPLRAEIDLTASAEELKSLTANLVNLPAGGRPADGNTPIAAQRGITLEITTKKSSGSPVLLIRSEQAMTQPFVDLAVELTASGAQKTLKRYTLFLNPGPESTPSAPLPTLAKEPVANATTSALVSSAPSVTLPVSGKGDIAAGSKPLPTLGGPVPLNYKKDDAISGNLPPLPRIGEDVKATPDAPLRSQPLLTLPPPVSQSAPIAQTGQYVVSPTPTGGPGSDIISRVMHSGENLRSIAERFRPAEISLEQMIAGIIRNTPETESGDARRLREGSVVNVPGFSRAGDVSKEEARRVVKASVRDFGAYQGTLAKSVAAQPAKVISSSEEKTVTGQVTPKVKDAVAKPKGDRLQISETELKSGAPAGKGNVAGEAVTAASQQHAKKEAENRMGALQKNLTDIKKLAEIEKSGAPLPKQSEQAQPTPAAKGETLPPATKPETKIPGPEISTNNPPPAKPAAKPAPASGASQPAQEFSLMGFFIENSGNILGVLGLLAALILVWFALRRRASKKLPVLSKDAQSAKAAQSLSGDEENELDEESAQFHERVGFGVKTGAKAAALATAVAATQSLAGQQIPHQLRDVVSEEEQASEIDFQAITANSQVSSDDPIAKADHLFAQGKTEEAEETLLDILLQDPSRLDVRLKLLEISATTGNLVAFSQDAQEVRDLTGGIGPEWERIQALGRKLDPANPLFAAAPAAVTEPKRTPPPPPPAAVAPPPHAFVSKPAPAVHEPPARLAATGSSVPAPSAPSVIPALSGHDGLSIDLGVTPAHAIDFSAAKKETTGQNTASSTPTSVSGTVASPFAPRKNISASQSPAEISFEAMAKSTPPGEQVLNQVKSRLADIDLELDKPFSAALPAAAPPSARASAFPEEEANSKLALADAYERMGDVEQARKLRAEVDALRAKAGLPVEQVAVADGKVSFGAFAPLDIPTSAVTASAPLAHSIADFTLDGGDDDAASKLELAIAYADIGDSEGARELFKEVLVQGTAGQKAEAERRLAALK